MRRVRFIILLTAEDKDRKNIKLKTTKEGEQNSPTFIRHTKKPALTPTKKSLGAPFSTGHHRPITIEKPPLFTMLVRDYSRSQAEAV